MLKIPLEHPNIARIYDGGAIEDGRPYLLFRLLTGVMPRSFDGLSPWEAEQQISSIEVQRPSTVARRSTDDAALPPGGPGRIASQLEGDLDAIVLKALRTEPASRFRSAGQLADDLERYGNRLPVAARQGNLRYRIDKLIRRHRLATALATLAIALGLGLVLSTAVSANRLARSQIRLLAEQDTLRTTQAFLLGMFKAAGPYAAEGLHLTLREAVDRQAGRIERELANQPGVQAAVLSTLGWVYLDLGVLDRALDYHQRALDLRRELDAESSEVAESLDGVAAALREQEQLDRAEVLSAAALDLHRRSNSDPSRLVQSMTDKDGT